MSHGYTLLDVFTDVPLEGNPLAVVHEADDLDDATMLRFAREMHLSETSFIQSASTPDADYRNRIWTMAREVPFAGHPSLGAAVAVAHRRGEGSCRFVQQTGAGLQPVDVQFEHGRWTASVLQERAIFGAELDAAAVMRAVGLAAVDADPSRPPQLVTTGLDTLIAAVGSSEAVGRAVPDFDRVEALYDLHDFNLYLVSLDSEARRARARMFSRVVVEDPATGSAVGPLLAYLAEREGWTGIEVTQGVEIGRPSRLVAELEDERVRVGGGVVVLIEGTVRL